MLFVQLGVLMMEGLAAVIRRLSRRFWPDTVSLLQNGLSCWKRMLDARRVIDGCWCSPWCFVGVDRCMDLDSVLGVIVVNLCIASC